jgi:hypothetical protein
MLICRTIFLADVGMPQVGVGLVDGLGQQEICESRQWRSGKTPEPVVCSQLVSRNRNRKSDDNDPWMLDEFEDFHDDVFPSTSHTMPQSRSKLP